MGRHAERSWSNCTGTGAAGAAQPVQRLGAGQAFRHSIELKSPRSDNCVQTPYDVDETQPLDTMLKAGHGADADRTVASKNHNRVLGWSRSD
jgi:hypothetical protein